MLTIVQNSEFREQNLVHVDGRLMIDVDENVYMSDDDEEHMRYFCLGRDKGGRNLLHMAVLFGREEVVTCLIEQYPDLVNGKDNVSQILLTFKWIYFLFTIYKNKYDLEIQDWVAGRVRLYGIFRTWSYSYRDEWNEMNWEMKLLKSP